MKTETLRFHYTVPVCSDYGSIEQNMWLSINSSFIGYNTSIEQINDNLIQQRISKDNADAVIDYLIDDETQIHGVVTGISKDVKKLVEELTVIFNLLIKEMWNN